VERTGAAGGRRWTTLPTLAVQAVSAGWQTGGADRAHTPYP